MYSTILTGGLHGIESYLARVEVDCARGLPGFEMVGLLGSEVKEARERIRVALKNEGFQLPPLKITVNISPASLHKEGTSYDLPVAVGILAAQGLIPPESVRKVLIVGELGLGGEIRPVRGILPMMLEAGKQGIRKGILPRQNLQEAGLLPDMRFLGVESLGELAAFLRERRGWEPSCPPSQEAAFSEEEGLDFGQVRGQEGAKRAALAAAAGFHHLLMVGPPGTGKSMIARCLPSILPPLEKEEQLETAAVYSVAGLWSGQKNRLPGRPFVDPHHTITPQALIGGGTIPRPGAVSLAHRGVLFLDELTEFRRTTLDLLRQPLEEGWVRIARSSGTYRFPADFMLAAAMNPCPCGYYPDRNRCTCTPVQTARYLGKISGPILDRIDLCVEVAQVDFEGLMGKAPEAEKESEALRQQVLEARARQAFRFREEAAGENGRLLFNGRMGPEQIRRYCGLGWQEEAYLKQLFEALGLSARGCHRLLRVARTLADLDGQDRIGKQHLSEAACYRLAGGGWKRMETENGGGR